MENKNKIIKNIISFIILFAVLFVAYSLYEKNNFSNYDKAEYTIGLSEFARDNKVKYNKYNSYKITNKDYNDALFYKTIKVTPNTPYKVTCKIKTENVISQNENTDVGANICIADTLEKSNNITGTTDWTEVTFYFNSKDREEVKLGFRLGGYNDSVIGTAWFSDLQIESGIMDETNTWNFLCLIFDNIDVNVNNNNIKLSLTQTDKQDITNCMRYFQNSMQEMSYGKMKVNYTIEETQTPITKISYDEENGYYVSGYDVNEVLEEYIKLQKYDHIFVVFRTGNINKSESIPVNDWIGLGSMEYRGLGYSNIRLPDDENNYIYKYDSRVNTFPEEVFMHEFLHTLEKNAKEYGYERPELHDNSVYGYENQRLIGLKDWYQDYMNKEINTNDGKKIGLPEEIFTKKPAKESNFEFNHKLDYLKEPENIIEEINVMIQKIGSFLSNDKN